MEEVQRSIFPCPEWHLNDCTFPLTQPGADFKLLCGHLAILWFEEGWDIFPAPLREYSHHPAAFTIKASVPVLGNMGRELFSHQERQIPLSLHQALPYIPAGKTHQCYQHLQGCNLEIPLLSAGVGRAPCSISACTLPKSVLISHNTAPATG